MSLQEVLTNMTNNLSCKGELCDALILLNTKLVHATLNSSTYGRATPMPIEVWGINEAMRGDATWILTSAFIIFTMQSGFGLLEAGSVSTKNEANIMIKNCMDVVFGGLSYWMFGWGLSFGRSEDPAIDNSAFAAFSGTGHFFLDSHADNFGNLYSRYFFQLSFATTATTIVSGAMAERTNLKGYIIFSFFNLISCVIPAHWLWDERGFLAKLGCVDVAGCGPVHLVGGASALVATLMLKPRTGIYDEGQGPPLMASPTNLVLGLFMLWWGWMGFNCGSTAGVSGGKWKLASRAAVVTINGSVGGGIWGVLYSYFLTKKFGGKLDIPTFVGAVLGGLVGITSICAVCRPWEALIIGFIGGIIASYGTELMWHLRIDDPVACVPVHGFCAVWGMLAVGLFGEKEEKDGFSMYAGIFRGGPIKFLFYQCVACVCIIAWSIVTTYIQLLIIDKCVGLRMSFEEELVGADYCEHGIEQKVEMLQTQAYGSHNTLMMMQSNMEIVEVRGKIDDHERQKGHVKDQDELCGICRFGCFKKFSSAIAPETVERRESYACDSTLPSN